MINPVSQDQHISGISRHREAPVEPSDHDHLAQHKPHNSDEGTEGQMGCLQRVCLKRRAHAHNQRCERDHEKPAQPFSRRYQSRIAAIGCDQ